MVNDHITINLSQTNCYLLEADEGYLLIDTGYEKDYDTFLKELDNRNIKLSQINHLLLTHHHDDHAGFVKELLNQTDLKIIAHKKAEELLKRGKNDHSRGGGIINRRVYYLFKFAKIFIPNLFGLTFPPVHIRDKDILVDGDDKEILKSIGIDGKILYTPGHTVDSISVLMDNGDMFCGDAAMNQLLWLGTRYHTIFITDLNEYYRSWKKIMKHGAKKLYPSHGEPFKINRLEENLGEYDSESLIEFF
ncbi:MAG: MBL fold metallo-hydrolase [Thermoplasmatota archaeon]